MGPTSSPFILILFPGPNLFCLITLSFRLLSHRWHWKKQTFLGSTWLVTTLSQLHLSLCSSLHSYREKIGLIPSPVDLSYGVEPHTTPHHYFLLFLDATSMTMMDRWERPRLASEFLSVLHFFELPILPPPPPEPLLLADKRIRGNDQHQGV